VATISQTLMQKQRYALGATSLVKGAELQDLHGKKQTTVMS
jgi:hypothetical protein